MEEVWRSYGPVEPIGPKAERSAVRRRAPLIAGVVAVCAAGAAAGLYLKPEPRATVRAERLQAAEREAANPPAPDQAGTSIEVSQALAEADELQAELQLAVADGGPQPVSSVAPSGEPLPAPSPGPTPSVAVPRPPAPPVYRPSTPPPPQARAATQRPTPQTRTAATTRAPSAVRPPEPASGPVRRRTSEAPLVVADAGRVVRTVPIYTPPQPVRAPEIAAPREPDCSGASTAADRMVCESPDLAALDRRLQAELAGAAAAGHNPALLARHQGDWRRRRDAAAPDPRAVADAYQRRIQQLQSMQ